EPTKIVTVLVFWFQVTQDFELEAPTQRKAASHPTAYPSRRGSAAPKSAPVSGTIWIIISLPVASQSPIMLSTWPRRDKPLLTSSAKRPSRITSSLQVWGTVDSVGFCV